MALNIFADGTPNDGSQVKANDEKILACIGQNVIRQLEDRAITYSAGQIDGWGEAYIDADGRNGSVDTTNTTAIYDSTSKLYQCINDNSSSSDTTTNPDSFSNPTNAFDGNTATYASKALTNSSGGTYTLGKTFGAKTVGYVFVDFAMGFSTGGFQTIFSLESYNGATWSTVQTLVTSTDSSLSEQKYIVPVNASVQGIRLSMVFSTGGSYTGGTLRVHELSYGPEVASSIIMNIPANTFSATISSAILSPKLYRWKTGANVEYKLTNASEDTGWLTCSNSPTISQFTAFTSEPTKLTIRLSPKSSSPTAGYPAISGAWVLAK